MPEPQQNLETQQQNDEINRQDKDDTSKKPSKIFGCLATITFWALLAALGFSLVLSAFVFDFLNIIQLRQKIPQSWRKAWPLSEYYDFVQLHQLPEEERYRQMLYQEQERYQNLTRQADYDLKERSKKLEDSYKGLIRTKKEAYNKEMEELRKQREELILREKKLSEAEKDLEKRKTSVDTLSKRLASEAINLESSLVRFMEQENRLDQVRSIAAQMSPQALGKIFDEVGDDKLIYDILSGLDPVHAGNVLSNIDPEKAGKIMRLGNQKKTLPPPSSPARDYMPQSLQNLINDSKSTLR